MTAPTIEHKDITNYDDDSEHKCSCGRSYFMTDAGTEEFTKHIAPTSGEIVKDAMTDKRKINTVISMLEELESCLDIEKGGVLAANLKVLYQFMIKTLKDEVDL
jgi:hypothetical protein